MCQSYVTQLNNTVTQYTEYSRAYSCISLPWTTCAGRRVGGRRRGGCNTCVCALKKHDYAKYSVSAVVIMGK